MKNKALTILFMSFCIVITMILFILLSGCIDNSQSPPPGYYPPKDVTIDVQLTVDGEPIGKDYYKDFPDTYPIFYFGDVVQDNGSVNVSKTENWTFTIKNYGSQTEDVWFKIVEFPFDLMIWSTELRLIGTEITHTPEYNFNRERFEREYFESISPNSTANVTFSVTLNKAREWSYNPDVSYVGRFELGYHVQDGNVYYEVCVVPFIIRT